MHYIITYKTYTYQTTKHLAKVILNARV